ncbi:SixA phosphatase family protein [Microvirga alba]|uniref:Histidine phosphatase family protein n=1 Tax=Microvirga alba TaxID=2791025 RepID=A0A931BNZ0_9HYPH|nr:histidine phosphatase family protein [Microvirga alba]MBF9233458.1 histidine phosphatase family protein [Microvirga alba]
MRRLLLLRHAKADRPPSMLDFDRPLAKRGQAAAVSMGKYLRDEKLLPDLVLVSPSKRTEQTWKSIEPYLGDPESRRDRRIYEATVATLLKVLHEVEPESRTVLMIGHNPGFEDLAQILIGHGDRDGLQRIGLKYPTAGLAIIDFSHGSWAELGRKEGRLERFVTPKSLGEGEDD